MSVRWTQGLDWPLGCPVGIELAGSTLLGATATGVAFSSAFGDALAIKAVLRHQGLGARRVHVVVCDPDHAHRTLLLPGMTRGEQAEVVRREVEREGEEGRVSAWRTVRQVVVDGIRKNELQIVSAPAARFQQVLDPVLREPLDLRVVVTGPVALMSAARTLSGEGLHRPVALVHWGPSALIIAVVSGGVPRFTRVIEPPAAGLDPREWVPVEIHRSMRHYGILSKGERVEQVMISVASRGAAERLLGGASIADHLRLPVTNLNALIAPRLPSMPLGDLAEGAFVLAYGAALSRPGEVPNLLPPAVMVRHRSRRIVAASVAANVVALCLIGSEFALASRDLRIARSRLQTMRAAQQARDSRAVEAARVEAERARGRELARIIAEQPVKHLPPADGLREIARVAPDQVRLDGLSLSLDAEGYVFKLVGGVVQADFADAQRDLNQFYYALRDSPLFYDVQIQQASSPASDVAVASAGAPDADGAADGMRERSLPFVILLRARSLM